MPNNADGLAPTALVPAAELGKPGPDRETDPAGATGSTPDPSGDDIAGGALPAGKRIGRYRIERRLGAGGMGVVYVAHDPELDRQVALKLVKPDGTGMGKDEAAARLLREARSAARVRHPNVVHVYDTGRVDDEVFIAMELVDGVPLRDWLKAEERPWQEIAAVLRGAAEGLAAAHAVGLVHRDFKPENVMVEKGRARVLDFGLARHVHVHDATMVSQAVRSGIAVQATSMTALTETGAILGTPAYMAPEQMQAGTVDARADQFAFGVTLFEALYGVRPFAGDNILDIAINVTRRRFTPVDVAAAGVPTALHEAVLRMIAVEPAVRFPAMDDVIVVLEPAREGAPSRRTAWIASAVVALGFAGWLASRSANEPQAEGAPREDESLELSAEDAEQLERDRILKASRLPKVRGEPVADDPQKVIIKRLENGLTVYLSNDPHIGGAVAAFVVRAGFADEPPGGLGTALVVARALEKGTSQLGSLDWEREAPLLAEAGGVYERLSNANSEDRDDLLIRVIEIEAQALTLAISDEPSRLKAELRIRSPDQARQTMWMGSVNDAPSPARVTEGGTVMIDWVPPGRLDAWAKITAEQVRSPSFRAFHETVDDVIQELERSADPERDARGRALAKLYPPHPNARWARMADVIADLRRFDIETARKFHADRYVPNNSAIVLAGDLGDVEAAFKVIEVAFDDWEIRDVPQPSATEARPVAALEEAPTPEAKPDIMVAWRRPAAGVAGDDEMRVLGHVLRTGALGFDERLKELGARVTSSTASRDPRGPFLLVHAQPLAAPGAAGAVEAALLSGIEGLKGQDYDDAALHALLKLARRELRFDGNTEIRQGTHWWDERQRVNDQVAAFLQGVEWADFVSKRDGRWVSRLTKEDVTNAAQTWLRDPVVVRVEAPAQTSPVVPVPFLPPPTPATSEPRWSSYAQDILDRESRENSPVPRWLRVDEDYEFDRPEELNSHEERIVVAHRIRDSTEFYLERYFPVDPRDPAACIGLELLDRLGTEGRDAASAHADLAEDGLVVKTTAWCPVNQLMFAGVDDQMERALVLFFQQLASASSVDGAAVDQLIDRERRILAPKPSMDIRTDLADRAVRWALAGEWKELHDTDRLRRRALKKLDGAAVASGVRRLCNLAPTIDYVGPRDPSEVAEAVNNARRDAGCLAVAEVSDAPRQSTPFLMRRHRDDVVLLLDVPDAPDFHVVVAVPGSPLSRIERLLVSRAYQIFLRASTPAVSFTGLASGFERPTLRLHFGRGSTDNRLAKGEAEAAPDEVMHVIEALMAELQRRPTESDREQLYAQIREDIIKEWIPRTRIPETVRTWISGGIVSPLPITSSASWDMGLSLV